MTPLLLTVEGGNMHGQGVQGSFVEITSHCVAHGSTAVSLQLPVRIVLSTEVVVVASTVLGRRFAAVKHTKIHAAPVAAAFRPSSEYAEPLSQHNSTKCGQSRGATYQC